MAIIGDCETLQRSRPSKGWGCVVRRRFKQTDTLSERLLKTAKSLRDRAAGLGSGEERTALIGDAEQCEAAAEMDEWLSSRELTPPK